MPDSQNFSQHDWQQQENLIAQFEEAFQQGTPPKIEEFILRSQEGIHRFSLLVELVHTEFEHLLKTNQPVRVEQYLARFPELTKNESSLQELIATEYLLRRRTEPELDIAEYVKRFPQLKESLISVLDAAAEHDQQNRFDFTAHAKTLPLAEDSTKSQIVDQPEIHSEQNQRQTTYGRYVVKKLLGAGAFGQVFLAHDPKAKRDIALKIPRRRLQAGSEEDQRFLREAQAVAKLRHPNICPLFDLLETDDRVVLVMPYIEGGSLAEKIKQQPFTLEQSVQLIGILASAMAYAHEAGVVHRDLKPANILIDKKQSQPMVTDFGLALRNDLNEIKLTVPGQILGTPAYMSPEQAGGEIENVGATSDIYSLGMILYELCTGQLPFIGSVTQVLGQIVNKKPETPTSINSEIPLPLEQIILKAIAKNPKERFRSMKEFTTALKQLPFDENQKPVFTKNWKAIAVIATLLLIAGIGTFFKFRSPNAKSNETVSQKPPISFEEIDLLQETQLPNDIVVGNWSRTPNGLLVTPSGFSRLSIPTQTKGDYQLELEFTRKMGHGEINVIFPVENRSCMLSLGRNQWCGLALPYGKEFGQTIPGHLPNHQRNKLILNVSTNKSQAFITAKLNGASILNWQGTQNSLSLRSDWQVQRNSFGLGAHNEQVVFHKMTLHTKSKKQLSKKHWTKHKTNAYQTQKNLLDEINPSQHTFRGVWQTDKHELKINRGGDFSRLILPVLPVGSYELQIHLTRIAGDGEINFILPVGETECMISLGKNGNQFGIQHINKKYWDTRKKGIFANEKEHLIQINVTLKLKNQASIRFQIDNNEMFHWQGTRKELTIREMWRTHPKSLSIGVDQDAVQFHKVLFQSKTDPVFQWKQK